MAGKCQQVVVLAISPDLRVGGDVAAGESR
jgi:hypothetical protein